MARPAAPIDRARLAAGPTQLLNRGNRRNPDVLLVEEGGRQIVVKDFAPRGALVRATIGRWITAREAKAYRRLEGHPSVPRFLGFLDPLAFALEFRPGRRVSRHLIDDAGPDFIDALDAAVAGLHERGLVHLDLGHRSNVLIDDRGEPVLIDFASAIAFRPGSWAARWLMPLFARYDRRAVAKYRDKLERQRSFRASRAAASGAGASEAGRSESRPT
jgi:RIO-like serine/threonine protein kinase